MNRAKFITTVESGRYFHEFKTKENGVLDKVLAYMGLIV